MGYLYELKEAYQSKTRQALEQELEERMLKTRPVCPACGIRGGVQQPQNIVSDGDKALAEAIVFVYGSSAPHRLCHFHLHREPYRTVSWFSSVLPWP